MHTRSSRPLDFGTSGPPPVLARSADATRSRQAGIDPLWVSAALALLVLALANRSLWTLLLGAGASHGLASASIVAAVAAALFGLCWLPLVLLSLRPLARTAWTVWLLLAAICAYFMDSYGLVIDRLAIQSVFETDPREASEWLSLRMLWYLLAALPVIVLAWRVPLRWGSARRQWGRVAIGSALALVLLAGGIALSYRPLAALVRNQHQIGHLIAPLNALEAVFSYVRVSVNPRATRAEPIGLDARLGLSWQPGQPPRLLVLVIGESARASSFGLLGYARDTNPELSSRQVLAFGKVAACGTSTAVSLPCMLSNLGQDGFSDRRARGQESVLDVVAHAGLEVTWIDNNTGSKGAAARLEELSVAGVQDPHWCGAPGCYDDLLIDRLEARLEAELANGGLRSGLLVLHQKGSHGPSYFERYPPEFRRFEPTCDGNDLGDCSREQILNTYDNSIVYTDHVLARLIDRLKARAGELDSLMLYVSDHGESTGEGGVFLHGAPYFMAPDEQRRVPMLLWASEGYRARRGLDTGCLAARQQDALSHDNLFHLLLGLLDVRSAVYRRGLDPFADCLGAAGASARAP